MPKNTNERGHHESIMGYRFDMAIHDGAIACTVELMDALAYAMQIAREYDEHLAQVNELIDDNVKLHKKVSELTAQLVDAASDVEPDACDWGGEDSNG